MRTDTLLLMVLLAWGGAAWAERPPAAGGMSAAHDHGAMTMPEGGRPMGWTDLPLLKIRMTGSNRQNREVFVVPQHIVAANVEAWSNDVQDAAAHRALPLAMAGAQLDKPATGGFHLLTAREEQGDTVRVASTVYYFGERGAKNPTAMFMRQKNELEIIPQPHPREHSRYRANERWRFLVRFNGQPLPNQKVRLETSNGSRTELLTDAAGVVEVLVPDDFRPIEEQKEGGGHDHGMRRGADFALAVEHAAEGKTYLTAFNSSYGPDAFDQRSLAMGLGFTLLGMLGAAPLLRRKEAGKPDAAATQEEV